MSVSWDHGGIIPHEFRLLCHDKNGCFLENNPPNWDETYFIEKLGKFTIGLGKTDPFCPVSGGRGHESVDFDDLGVRMNLGGS